MKCSQALEDMINHYGGNPIMWKTGHSLIKQKMTELGCKFGGEMSDHIFFADDYLATMMQSMCSEVDRTIIKNK